MAESKEDKLDRVLEEAQGCTRCELCKNKSKNNANKIVFQKGNINAKIMLIGEAPGQTENECGEPFKGKSGQQLDALLTQAGFNPEKDIYFCNVVKCRPVKNNKDRKPSAIEIGACRCYLDSQIEIINPKIIILCGNTAKKFFGIKEPMREVNGKIINHEKHQLIPVYHPRASVKNKVKLSALSQARNKCKF